MASYLALLKINLTNQEQVWEGRWEGGSCLGTHVRIKDFKIKKIKKNAKKINKNVKEKDRNIKKEKKEKVR